MTSSRNRLLLAALLLLASATPLLSLAVEVPHSPDDLPPQKPLAAAESAIPIAVADVSDEELYNDGPNSHHAYPDAHHQANADLHLGAQDFGVAGGERQPPAESPKSQQANADRHPIEHLMDARHSMDRFLNQWSFLRELEALADPLFAGHRPDSVWNRLWSGFGSPRRSHFAPAAAFPRSQQSLLQSRPLPWQRIFGADPFGKRAAAFHNPSRFAASLSPGEAERRMVDQRPSADTGAAPSSLSTGAMPVGVAAKPASLSPAVDISETPTAFHMHAELPGFKLEDIDLEVDGNQVVLKGHRQDRREESDAKWLRVERFSGDFYRRFLLPQQVEHSSVTANFKDGVLDVTFPKVVATHNSKRVAINSA